MLSVMRICCALFLIFSALICSPASGQNVVPLFPGPNVDVRFAAISPDGKFLAVALASDSLVIKDATTLQNVKVISAFTANAPMTYVNTGRQIFHITADNDIIYIKRKIEGNICGLYLVRKNIITDRLKYELKVYAIPQSEFETEKLYNRLVYHINATKTLVTFSLNEKILAVDIASGQIAREWSVPFSFFATMSPDQKWLAYSSADSVQVIDIASKTTIFKTKTQSNGLSLKGDTVITFGNEGIFLWNVRTKRKIQKLYHQKGFVYGISFTTAGDNVTFSNSYFDEKGFTASYNADDFSLTSVYHLPKTDGFISFFHPQTRDRWLVTAHGLLYRFHEADQPQPVSQSAHRKTILSLDFSSDRRTMISTAQGGEIILWDVGTGKVIERYQTNDLGITAGFFDPNDRDIIYQSYDDFKKIHRSIPSNPDWGSAYNVFIDSADQVYTAKLKMKREADVEKGKALSTQFGLDDTAPTLLSKKYLVGFSNKQLTSVALSARQVKKVNLPDAEGQYSKVLAFYREDVVALEGNGNTILFVDLETGNVIKRLGKIRAQYRKGVNKILFNETADTLISVVNDNVIQLWDLRKAEKIAEFNPAATGVQEHAVDYRKGRLTFIGQNNNLYIASVLDVRTNRLKMMAYLDTTFYQKPNDELELAAQKGLGYPYRMALSPDGKQLVVLRLYAPYNGKAEVFVDWWDLSGMKVTQSVPLSSLSSPCWNVSWEHQKMAVWDHLAMSAKEQAEVIKMGSSVKGGYGAIYIIDMPTKKIDEVSLEKIRVSRLTEKSVRIASKTEAWIKDEATFDLHLVDLSKKVAKSTIDVSKQYLHDEIGSQWLTSKDLMIYSLHPWSDGFELQLRSRPIAPDAITTHSTTSGSPITALSDIAINQSFAVGLNNNVISVLNAGDLKERFHIVQDDDGHYAFLTPDNYYKTDRVSASALQFNWNHHTYALHQFDAFFNRPDKVLATTGFARSEDIALLERSALKRVKNKSFTSGAIPFTQLPLVRIQNMNTIPFTTAADSVEIVIDANAPSGKIVALHYKVNGVPTRGSKGVSVKPGEKVSIRQYVRLLPGTNRISVTAETENGITSLPDEVEIVCTAEKKRPKLFVFAVAINNYKDPSLKLNYAVKDARDLLNFYKNDKRYSSVTIDSVFNASATAPNILGLSEKLKKVGVNDMVILFFAGHGVLDQNFDFRFGTWALDASKPMETAMLYDDIHKLMDGIAPRNKLLLIDACHSGEVDKDEIIETTERVIRERNGETRRVVTQTFDKVHHNVFASGLVDRTAYELMQDVFLARGSDTGAQVVVATAGDSYAIESDEWKNGFFTYAFLNGLKSGAADLNRDQTVTVDELVGYLKAEVKRMSEGKQMPRFREENPENYFSVWDTE